MATIRKHRRKWQVQVRRAGAKAYSKSFQLRKDAEEWAREMERRADRQDLPQDAKVLGRTTLRSLVERYVNTVTVKKRGAHFERAVLRRFMKHNICSRKLSELRTEHFAAYRDERLPFIKASTLKRQLNPVRHMFEIARDEWGMPIERNPLKKLKLDAQDQRRERRLREGEFSRLIEAAKSRRNPLIESVIRFAVATGMRRGEILAVRWKHVDRAQRSLLIPDTKTGQSRTIPLVAAALEVLAEQRQDAERVFPITANAFRLAWERVRLKAGVEDLHFHDLRHDAISRFFELGLSVPEVALISGHKDLRMLFRYAHAARQAILAKLEGATGSEQGGFSPAAS
ncbi:integrase [Bradyrhizobium ottawaense]|uniref:integrase n=1 Tax=Bradyrhizobium ottawaense TaxID=931866 RepID=UPI0035136AD1